jgi:hypothetical protein
MRIPDVLLHIILEYDGRIKYRNGEYVNIIHKNDDRYNVIRPLIVKKTEIMKKTQLKKKYVQTVVSTGFYMEFCFGICQGLGCVGLVYDYNFSYKDTFEICYFDLRNNGLVQIRTYL